MSLLLDALKRAEQEKLARGERPDLQVVGQPAPAAAAQPQAPSAAPAPSMQLEPMAGQAAAGAPPKAHAASAHAAQNLFQAKGAAAEGGSRRGVLVAAVVAIVLAIGAGGAYVWYQMKSLAPATPIARAPLPPPAPVVAAPTPAPAAAVAPPPAKPSPEKATPPAQVAAVTPAAPEARKPAPRTREQMIQKALEEAPANREPPLQMERATDTPRVPREIAAGYEALRTGDLEFARRSYQAALAANPDSIDAYLGVATIEARAGRIAAAAAGYRRVLELDPRNVTAVAGLAALADASRPGNVEAQLRQDLMMQPNGGALHLALGNLLAEQGRWSEAQAEYFEAHRLDPGNADIAHNLAVSLDNLGQAKLASDFYRRALAAAREQPSQLDTAAVMRRLAELER